MIPAAFKKILTPLLQRLTKYYLLKERNYNYQNLKLVIQPGVFHPGLFFSTHVLLKFLSEHELAGTKILELGAGSGLIALFAVSKGAEVTASDINLTALKNIEYNADKNKLNIKVVESDLFERLDSNEYDWIVINPPFYPRDPTTESERAWFCGKDFDYFVKLFDQLRGRLNPTTNVIMVLSQDCDLTTIQTIASQSALRLDKIFTVNGWWEKNEVYKIVTK